MTARVDSDGTVTQLDGRVAPPEVVTAEDAKDPDKVARLLARLLAEIATLKRRHAPQRVVFRNIVLSATAMSQQTVRLHHGFGGAVNWWVADWVTGTPVAAAVDRHSSASTDDELVLVAADSGTVTIVVEEAG